MLVDAVTSLGAHPVDVAGWQLDAVLQLHAEGPRRAVGPRAGRVLGRARRSARRSRSFYFDLDLLEDYWVGRKYHHTIVGAARLRAARGAASRSRKKALEARWARHAGTTSCSPPASARWVSSCCRPKASGSGR